MRPRRRLATLLVLTVAVGACSRPTSKEADPDDPGVSHVHGLGVDPSDGTLFAATHYGLFKVPEDGTVERVADRFQDTMGFLVIGPRHFLGSGHPDIQDDELQVPGKPPHLGLIESQDAGDTWHPLSLLGEADLHAIAAVGDRIAAYDATQDRLLISADAGRSWSDRISGIGMMGLAMDPRDPERLVTVTPAGIELSEDGGRTFKPLNGAPRAVLISWNDDRLYALDASGELSSTEDVGAITASTTWRRLGSVRGAPQAFVATDVGLFAAVSRDDTTMIFSSQDGGDTWKLRHRDRPAVR